MDAEMHKHAAELQVAQLQAALDAYHTGDDVEATSRDVACSPGWGVNQARQWIKQLLRKHYIRIEAQHCIYVL